MGLEAFLGAGMLFFTCVSCDVCAKVCAGCSWVCLLLLVRLAVRVCLELGFFPFLFFSILFNVDLYFFPECAMYVVCSIKLPPPVVSSHFSRNSPPHCVLYMWGMIKKKRPSLDPIQMKM